MRLCARLISITLLAGTFGAAQAGRDSTEEYRSLALQIREEALARTLREIASEPRLGSPSAKVVRAIRSSKLLGAVGEVRSETFPVILPDAGARAEIRTGAGVVTAFPLWPNGVRTSTCSVRGRLVYAGDGQLASFDGLRVEGSIVVLNFDSGDSWRIAAQLGASAVVFVDANLSPPTRAEADEKWSMLPLDVPRLYVPVSDAGPLFSAIGSEATIECSQTWTKTQAENLFVTVRGSDRTLRDEWVLVSAYTDSVSVVPGLYHGADQSCGAAALIEIAKALKRLRPKRSVLFLLTSGHYQAMEGVRRFIERRFEDRWAITDGKVPQFAFTLDLSSGSPTIAALAQGWWVAYRDENISHERDVAAAMRSRVSTISSVLGVPERELFLDGVNNPDGRHWKNTVPAKFAVESEIHNLAGLNSITFITSNDRRVWQDTPEDGLDKVDTYRLTTQARTIACLLWDACNDSQSEDTPIESRMPFGGGSNFKRMSLIAGFATISGRVLKYDPRHGFLPDVSMVGSLVVKPNTEKAYMGVRGQAVARAEAPDARYVLYGCVPVTAHLENQRYPTPIWAFTLDKSGSITHALDFKREEVGDFSSYFTLTTSYREATLVVFEAVQIDLYGLADPHLYKMYQQLQVLDARNNGTPREYSFVLPWAAIFTTGQVDDSAVLYLPAGTRYKVLGFIVPGEARLVLTGATPERPDGEGYVATRDRGAPPTMNPALSSARDLLAINRWRMRRLAEHRIINPSISDLTERAEKEIVAAEKAHQALEHRQVISHARAAWAYALRAHPLLLATTRDVLNGLIFYLFLLLPFAYFAERLLFASKELTKQMLRSGAIFILVFVLLRILHPAFDLTGNTFMIFVAFTMGALSLIVMAFISGKFESSISHLEQQAMGKAEKRIGRFGIAVTALNIGLSNMRRRKARTILTCVTLCLVTFIVLSFTSVVPALRFNDVPAPGTPRYAGVLFRYPDFSVLDESAFASLRSEFSASTPISRRAWFFGAEIGTQSVLTLTSRTSSTEVACMFGLDPDEAKLTRIHESMAAGGRWFTEEDRFTMILPRSVANRLGLGPRDVGKETVEYGGQQFTLIGIFEDAKLRGIRDLDDEVFLPANFAQSRQQQRQSGGGDRAFRKFVRLDTSGVFFVPARTALALGAETYSIAVSTGSMSRTAEILANFMPRTGLNLYGAVLGRDGPEIRRFSTVAGSQTRGLELVVIPVLIAAIIVLNTMIASVMERKREISIFSAIGLAPSHIASLFFVESLVYAVLGSFVGYLAAQVTAVAIAKFGLFPGLTLNYSSASAVLATLLVVGIVLLSTLYPARVAARVANPAKGDLWEMDPPEGDQWNVALPFTVSTGHAQGLARFYAEWLRSCEQYSIGEFVSEATALEEDQGGIYVSSRLWLAPYDLGVQQTLRIEFQPAEIEAVWKIRLHILRVSGDPEQWQTLNHRFFAALRRQFLYWRTLTPTEKAIYTAPQTA